MPLLSPALTAHLSLPAAQTQLDFILQGKGVGLQWACGGSVDAAPSSCPGIPTAGAVLARARESGGSGRWRMRFLHWPGPAPTVRRQ